ncbi:MAG: T9SS type A sorting domain-containing protein [Bacteroidota bacterium]
MYRINDENGNQSNVAILVIKFVSTLPDSLTISNINALINPNNINFWDQNYTAHFYAPKGSGKGTMFCSTLCIAGIRSSDNQLCFAADTYGNYGIDFYQGPLKIDDSGTDSLTMALYNRSWKVNSSQIDALMAYQANPSAYPNYVIPEAILNWPAHGGAGYANNIAPFVDVDQDGIYEPQHLDYPKIKGDEAMFYVVNDKGGIHSQTGGLPLGMEIQVMAYAFDCSGDSALYNSIFIDYTIINRSTNTYNKTYIASFNDFDIGDSRDDYMGCDVLRSTMYGYNGATKDGNGEVYSYGANPPIQSIAILRGPKVSENGLDDASNDPLQIANGFGYNDGIIDNEEHGMDFFVSQMAKSDPFDTIPNLNISETMKGYNALQAIYDDSTRLLYSNSNDACKFLYPGLSDLYNWGTAGLIPTVDKNWTEITSGNVPYDRKGWMSSGGFTFLPGATQHFELAYTYNRNYSDTSRLAALPIMQARVDSLRSYFKAERTPCGSIFASIEKKSDLENTLKVYPNPANDYFKVEYTSNKNEAIIVSVYDINGRVVITKKANTIIGKNTISLNTNELNSGVYIVKIETSMDNKVVRLVIN